MALNGTGFTGTGQLGGEVNLQGSTGSGYDSSSFDADFAQKSVGNLSDVELGAMTGRDVLLWDSANAQFENRALLEADLPASVMFENENISLLNNDVPYFDTAGVGLDNSTSTVHMAVDTMANLGAPPASNDEFPIYDQSAGSHNSVTFGNLEQGIDAANISSGFTDGSVIFSNGGQLAEDNSNFFWDVNNARLALGKNTANETLDINGNAAISNKVILSPISNPTYAEGQLWYSADTTTLSFQNDRSGVTLNIGEETWLRVRNNSGATISNGEAVYINGFDTGSGFPTVELAQADSATTADMVGLATEDIANNSSGMITTYGLVREVDTSAYSAGDTLYLSPSTPGALTTTEPSSPNFSVRVGKVSRSNIGGGQILVGVSDIREAIYTQGSIPYADADGRLIDDNANLSWDGTDLNIGGSNAIVVGDNVSDLNNDGEYVPKSGGTFDDGVEFNGNNGLPGVRIGGGGASLGNDGRIYIEDSSGNLDRIIIRQSSSDDMYFGDIDDNGGNVIIRTSGSDRLEITDTDFSFNGNEAWHDGNVSTGGNIDITGRTISLTGTIPSSNLPENVYNVKTEEGAAGDGVTDDTTAIQNAMIYAGNNPGTTIYFPQGTYIINATITIPTKTKIVGEGMNTTTIKNGSSTNFTLTTPIAKYNPSTTIRDMDKFKPMLRTDSNGVEDVEIKHIGLDWNDVDGSGDGNSEAELLIEEAKNCTVEYVKFHDMDVWGSDGNYQTDGVNVLFAFAENCYIEKCEFGYTDYESLAIQYVCRYIHVRNNHFNINKPFSATNQRHLIQPQVPQVYTSDLDSEFGRHQNEEIYIDENICVVGGNVSQCITLHDTKGGTVGNNKIIYTTDVNGFAQAAIRAFDGSEGIQIFGNEIDTRKATSLAAVYLGITTSLSSQDVASEITIEDNLLYIKNIPSSSAVFGCRGSLDKNIIISQNIVKIDGYDNDSSTQIFNVLGNGWSVKNNIIEVVNPNTTITSSGPVFADCDDLSDFEFTGNIVRGANIGQGVTYGGTIERGIVKNNILDTVQGTEVPDNASVNSADTTDYIYDYGGDVQATGSERFLVYNGVGSNNTFIDGTDSIENQAVIPLAGKIKKLTIRHAGNLSTNNATATIYVNGASQGTFSMTGGANSSDQGDFDITVSALDYVSISINGSGTAPGFCVANLVMR